MAPTVVPASEYANYSVGWICALPDDMAAAKVMLDREHGQPENAGHAGDTNSYFLGSIHNHNVVITCLPAGTSGSASAATVAMHLQRTFTSVRIGLLVGVGSGAPSSSADIRLGDVIVSMPTDGTGGVIQYERTVTELTAPDGSSTSSTSRFHCTRSLNKPPMMLLTTLSQLQAEYKLRGSNVGDILQQSIANYPLLLCDFTAPASHEDRLYEAHYVHVTTGTGSGEDEGTCDRCDINMLIRCPDRHFTGPQVHSGIIASSSEEIKCSLLRDQARDELGAICFESEAAGLMDNFPCIVIRGVSDYADSHAVCAGACTLRARPLHSPRKCLNVWRRGMSSKHLPFGSWSERVRCCILCLWIIGNAENIFSNSEYKLFQ
jgi:nucleoside phosphorylase